MGILSIAMTPHKALSKVSFVYRAAIILNPEELPDYTDYVTRLQNYSPTTPAFAVTAAEQNLADGVFDGRFSSSSYAANMLKKIVEFSNSKRLPPPGDYRRSIVDLSAYHTTPTILGKGFDLTKTECMVLRYLVRIYPQPAKPDEIISHIYNPTKAPNESNIRTYVSVINKKSIGVFGKSVITSVPKKGYAFSD